MNGLNQEEATILAAQQALGQALVERDVTTLAELLDDALEYVHSTGLRHDRDAYLHYVQSGPTFLSVRMDKARVILSQGLAVVDGLLALTLLRPDEDHPQSLHSVATQVWLRGPQGWRLRRAQTTRLA